MILGNPYTFAILIEPIKMWTDDYDDDYWVEGVFDFIIDGKFISSKIYDYTFNSLFNLSSGCNFIFSQPIDDKYVFFLEKEEAFVKMLFESRPFYYRKNTDGDWVYYEEGKVYEQYNEYEKYEEYYQNNSYVFVSSELEGGAVVLFVSCENKVRIMAAITDELKGVYDENGRWIRNEWDVVKKWDIHETIITLDEFNLVQKECIDYIRSLDL